jgi:hypothetical protein
MRWVHESLQKPAANSLSDRRMCMRAALISSSMMRLFVARVGTLASVFCAVTMLAMTVVPTDFNQLLDRAEQIYKAQVVSVESDWSGEGVNRHPATFVRLRVLESYRGGAVGEQTLEFSGGAIGQRILRIPGMPEFQPGDIEILFVRGNHTEFCPLVGIFHGRLRVVKNGANGAEEILLHDGTPLFDMQQVGQSSDGPNPRAAAAAARAAAQKPGGVVRALTSEELGATIRTGLRQRGVTPDKS